MKTFTDSKLAAKELRRLICLTAKSKGINRVVYNNRAKEVGGTYNASNKNIFLALSTDNKEMLTCFFHELGHHVAVQEGMWVAYHFSEECRETPEQQFEIENHIDKIAKKLWNELVDIKRWGRYKYSYPKTLKRQLTAWLSKY